MPPSKPTVCVLLPHGYDARAWRERHRRGEVLDASPYGYGLAAERFDLRWSRDRRETALASLLRRGLFRLLGTDIVHVWRNRLHIRSADVVWTHTEEEYLAVVLLRRLLGHPKVLAQTIWLWDEWAQLGPVRRAVLRRLIARVDLEIVLSSLNRDLGRRTVSGRRIVRVPFGTSIGHVSEGSPRRSIFAPGNDRHRDWDTLLDAAALLPDVDVVIASSSSHFQRIAARRGPLPSNVQVRPKLNEQQLADAYRDAAAVVIPLTENLHASGVTVAIEALGRGCVVVATDVGGLGEYLQGAEAVLVPHSDAAALAAAIRPVVEAPTRSVQNRSIPSANGLTQRDYIRRLELATSAVLGAPWRSEIEDFTSVLPSTEQSAQVA